MFIRALNALIGLNCPDQLQGNPHSLISPGTAQESCFHSCLLDEPWTYLPSPAACGWTLWAHPSPYLELCNHCWVLPTVFESCGGVVSWLGSAQPYLGSPSVPTRLLSWRNSTLVASWEYQTSHHSDFLTTWQWVFWILYVFSPVIQMYILY